MRYQDKLHAWRLGLNSRQGVAPDRHGGADG
jgi:hypothetical protein